MRNVYIYLSLVLLLCAKGRGQGSDVIFLIDNSSSISPTEYTQLQNSIAILMGEVLECNDANRISVVQYSQLSGPRIFIQSDFVSTSYTFSRAYNDVGNVPGSINLLANALSSSPSLPGITSTQKKLNRTPGNALVVYLFTDAPRNSDLVTGTGAGDPAFASYTNFKNTFGATFIVTIVVTAGDTTAAPAAASIASVGGGYMGTIEGYPSDPDGQLTLPRYLLVKNNFNLSTAEIEIVTDDICSVAEPDCVPVLTLTTPAGDDVSATDTRQTEILINASNRILSGGVGIYHSEQTIVLTPGFHSVNGSRFRGYIDACNSGYEGRPGHLEEESNNISHQQVKFFTLSPNPASEIVKVFATENIQSIVVTSFDGKTVFTKDFRDGVDNYELYIGNYLKGFYSVTVTTQQGQLHTEKLIKD